jgi:hypothetical protein
MRTKNFATHCGFLLGLGAVDKDERSTGTVSRKFPFIAGPLEFRLTSISDKARDWTIMRCLVCQFDLDVVDIAPAPTLGGVVALDNRMSGRFKVPPGMTVGRVVAATDMPATAANPQMHPRRSHVQALLTTERARGNGLDLMSVRTSHFQSPNFSMSRSAFRRRECAMDKDLL